jgi:hypothetical protein
MVEGEQKRKGEFYVKAGADGEQIELIDTFESSDEFKRKVCLPYFKDIFKVIVENE